MSFTDNRNSLIFSALSATPANFSLNGGRYGMAVNATWGGGSVTLNVLMPDGSTAVKAGPSFTADGSAVFDLPAGTYQITIATATAVQGFLVPVPASRNV